MPIKTLLFLTPSVLLAAPQGGAGIRIPELYGLISHGYDEGDVSLNAIQDQHVSFDRYFFISSGFKDAQRFPVAVRTDTVDYDFTVIENISVPRDDFRHNSRIGEVIPQKNVMNRTGAVPRGPGRCRVLCRVPRLPVPGRRLKKVPSMPSHYLLKLFS